MGVSRWVRFVKARAATRACVGAAVRGGMPIAARWRLAEAVLRAGGGRWACEQCRPLEGDVARRGLGRGIIGFSRQCRNLHAENRRGKRTFQRETCWFASFGHRLE